jgi:hypothetical protein
MQPNPGYREIEQNPEYANLVSNETTRENSYIGNHQQSRSHLAAVKRSLIVSLQPNLGREQTPESTNIVSNVTIREKNYSYIHESLSDDDATIHTTDEVSKHSKFEPKSSSKEFDIDPDFSDLVVAKLLMDDDIFVDDHYLPAAIQYDPEKKAASKRSSRRRICLGALRHYQYHTVRYVNYWLMLVVDGKILIIHTPVSYGMI